MSGWLVRAALVEGTESWRHGRWRTIGLHAVLVLAVAVPLAADLHAVNALLREEGAWLRDGGDVLVASGEGGVDRAGCEGLNQIDGVAGAGAVTLLPAARLSVAPDEPVAVLGFTPGVARVAGFPALPGRALVTPDVAERYGWRAGSHLVLTPGQARSLRSGPPDPVARNAALPTTAIQVGAVRALTVLAAEHASGVVLEQAADGLADACYVRADLSARAGMREALPALVAPGTGSQVSVADRLVSGKFATDYAESWSERPLRAAPWLAGVFMALAWLLMRWTTRAADGLYVTLGARRGSLLLIRGTEWSLQLGIGVATGLAAAGTYAVATGLGWSVVWPELVRYGIVSAATASVLASFWAFLPRPSALAALKDR